MNNITFITRKEIIKVLLNGCDYFDGIPLFKINYWGDLDIVTFLNRLYDLRNLPSLDSRYDSAEVDIHVHCVVHEDYPLDFIFSDSRFNLIEGSDVNFLNFLCEVFHPEVRVEASSWKFVLNEVNKLLQADFFELYPSEQISGRDIYSWKKTINPEDYLPFSIRNKEEIQQKTLKFSLRRGIREQIFNIIQKNDVSIDATTETGFNYSYYISEDILKRIRDYYTPKCYSDSNVFSETNDLQQFILKTTPYCVLDVIEIFSQLLNSVEFDKNINKLFNIENFPYALNNNLINGILINKIEIATKVELELGVTDLLQMSVSYYNNGNKAIAVEKLWDAFERVKTVINSKNKSKSVTELINRISHNEKDFIDLFTTECIALTKIGNDFRIRHHETNRIEITRSCDYDYLFQRCSSFVNLAIKYI